jgi:hypothetical protein
MAVEREVVECVEDMVSRVVNDNTPSIVYGPHPKIDWQHPAVGSYTDIIIAGYSLGPLDEPTVAKMNCGAMRELAAQRGLPMTGNKATLRGRLLNAKPNKPQLHNIVRRNVLWAVWDLIRRYGETGYGDKPPHMDPTEYWLAHIQPARFAQTAYRAKR